MQIEGSVLNDFFKIPRSETKTAYNKRADVKIKLEEISMFCIKDSLCWDTELREKDVLIEEFFEYLFKSNSLQGWDGMIQALISVEFIQVIEDEFCIEEIDLEAGLENIETLTNYICSELKIKG
tara:strand:- start:396 stop:767 length:372 start_codon:yes stop_codon:yes gene_type:complete